ncbi:MAG: M48 family metallopeptidase [Rhodocyclales bacterium]|nr:M48 family metallopeptidase [Rhodocyclales bacterium]
MSSATIFSSVFLLALAVSSGIRVWLALRQYRHVAAHREVVPFEFAASVPLADHRKAADYTQAKIRLALVALAVEIVLLLALTLGGLLQRLDETWFDLLGGRGYGHGLALFASVGVISFCVDLPFSLYRTFVLEARFAFNKMTWRTAMADFFKQAVLAVVIGAPLLLAVLWLMAAMGERWWLYVWLFWLGFNLLVMLIYPTLIAPLFNKFSPLPDGDLKERIGRLLERCGFTASGLFVMDGSKRSAHGNAYFTGLGRAKRIVFFDTLIDKLKPAEVEAVLAHELGHFKRRHIWKRIAVMAAISLGLLWILGQLIAEPWFYQGLGVMTPSTAMALLLFSQALPAFLFPLTPLASLLSRRHEYEADSYAASHANAGDLVTALVSLYRDNAATLTPDPLHSLFYDSHPPASLRIAHLRGY